MNGFKSGSLDFACQGRKVQVCMPRILVVEDEPDISGLIALQLKRQGHECHCVGNGLEALPAAIANEPDLVLLDWMLPGLDGPGVLKALRGDARTREIPVVLLTARSRTADRIQGLECGADDYLTKPFSPRELNLRIEAILRRSHKVTHVSELRLGAWRIDRRNLKAYFEEAMLDLTSTEFKLLATLIENPAVVHTRADLLRVVWGYSDEVHSRTLDTHIKRLREKLASCADCITTVRGIGYQFTA